MTPAVLRPLAIGVLALASAWPALADFTNNNYEPRVWQEDATVVPPTSFSTDKLVPFEVSRASELRYGIDPATLSIGADQVVRYVMVASSSGGAQNVLYEGIHCDKGEVKTYARWEPASADAAAHWNVVERAEWRSLFGVAQSRPALVLARSGLCDGTTPNRPVSKMVRDLRNPPNLR